MDIVRTLFDIGLFIFGSLSVYGILFFRFQIYFSSSALTKIGTAMIFLIFTLVFGIGESAAFRSLSVFCVISAFGFGINSYIRFLEKTMLNQVHHFIKNIILQMKLGTSFRKSLELSMHFESSPFMQTWLKKIYDNVVFTQHKRVCFRSQMLIKLISELKLADKDQNSALKRVENLYSWLKIQSDFRRKSGKVMAQMRIQSTFIVVMYIALIVFISKFIGFREVLSVLPLSLTLMVIGVTLVFYFGRRMKWNL